MRPLSFRKTDSQVGPERAVGRHRVSGMPSGAVLKIRGQDTAYCPVNRRRVDMNLVAADGTTMPVPVSSSSASISCP